MNLLSKLSYLNYNFALTQGYLNPALNSLAQEIMIDSCQAIKNSQTMKWKRKMPEDYFLLVNLSLVSRMELFDIIYHLLKLNKVSYHGDLHALFTIYPG